jgi:magnesium-transporting ATPase (P-type)
MVLVRSANSNGIAYIETKNLDGETNLKLKAAEKDL